MSQYGNFPSVVDANTDTQYFTYTRASTKDSSVAYLVALAQYDLVHEIHVSFFAAVSAAFQVLFSKN